MNCKDCSISGDCEIYQVIEKSLISDEDKLKIYTIYYNVCYSGKLSKNHKLEEYP